MDNKPRGILIDDKINPMSTQLVHRLREEIISGNCGQVKDKSGDGQRAFRRELEPVARGFGTPRIRWLGRVEDNRGYRVAPVSLANLAEVTQLRTEFECSALRHAMTSGDVDWEADVMRDLYRLSRITRDPAHAETLARWEAAHAEFHMTLIAGCNMPLLQNTCRVLHNLNDRYRRIFLRTEGGDRNVAAEHTEIATLAVRREIEPACDSLRNHIQRTGTNLYSYLSHSLALAAPDPLKAS